MPHAVGGQATLPNSFSSGDVIRSAEFNDNFTALRDEINDNDSRITTLEASPRRTYSGYMYTDMQNSIVGLTTNVPAGEAPPALGTPMRVTVRVQTCDTTGAPRTAAPPVSSGTNTLGLALNYRDPDTDTTSQAAFSMGTITLDPSVNNDKTQVFTFNLGVGLTFAGLDPVELLDVFVVPNYGGGSPASGPAILSWTVEVLN